MCGVTDLGWSGLQGGLQQAIPKSKLGAGTASPTPLASLITSQPHPHPYPHGITVQSGAPSMVPPSHPKPIQTGPSGDSFLAGRTSDLARHSSQQVVHAAPVPASSVTAAVALVCIAYGPPSLARNHSIHLVASRLLIYASSLEQKSTNCWRPVVCYDCMPVRDLEAQKMHGQINHCGRCHCTRQDT